MSSGVAKSATCSTELPGNSGSPGRTSKAQMVCADARRMWLIWAASASGCRYADAAASPAAIAAWNRTGDTDSFPARWAAGAVTRSARERGSPPTKAAAASSASRGLLSWGS